MNSIHEFVLDNGLKIFVKADHRAPVVTCQIWYKIGSSYECDGITGISHFLEHMMFRGSKNTTMNKVIDQLPLYGGMQNAFTSHDYTVYYATLPVDRLSYYARFEADRMQHLMLSTMHFQQEKEIVMEERRMMIDNNPYSRAQESFTALAYLTSPYRHPIIGWMRDIEQLTVQHLRAWYHRWYCPNNALVVIVGDVKPAATYQLIKRLFSAIPPKKLLLPNEKTIALPQGGREMRIALPAKLPWLSIGYPVPVWRTATQVKDVFALMVLTELLAGGTHSLLKEKLVVKDEIALDVGYRYSPFERLQTIFTIRATPHKVTYLNKTQQTIFTMIDRLKNAKVSPDELQRVKSRIIAGRIYHEDSIEYQANEIGCFEAVGLTTRDIYLALEHIHAITTNDIQQVAARYLAKNAAIITRLYPLAIQTKEAATSLPESDDDKIS